MLQRCGGGQTASGESVEKQAKEVFRVRGEVHRGLKHGNKDFAGRGRFLFSVVVALFFVFPAASMLVNSGSGVPEEVVLPGPLADIIVSPSAVSMTADETKTFSAVGYDSYGNVVQANFD